MSKAMRAGRKQTAEYRAKLTALNDAFRMSFSGGKVFLTAGVAGLPQDDRAMALLKVAFYDDFDEANDPWSEHEFGAFDWAGNKFFWKIEYYDLTMEKGSEDATDPEKTTRVLTLMLAEEY